MLSKTGSDLDLLSMGEFVRFVGSCGQDRDRLIRRVILGIYIFPILRPALLFLTHKHAQIQNNGMIASNDSHSKWDGQVHGSESFVLFNEWFVLFICTTWQITLGGGPDRKFDDGDVFTLGDGDDRKFGDGMSACSATAIAANLATVLQRDWKTVMPACSATVQTDWKTELPACSATVRQKKKVYYWRDWLFREPK